MSVVIEMPKYVCHKTVWALKIQSIEFEANSAEDGTAIIRPADEGYAPFVVSRNYMEKHKPTAGGYYVVYHDGYASFSPAQAFEEGYTPVKDKVKAESPSLGVKRLQAELAQARDVLLDCALHWRGITPNAGLSIHAQSRTKCGAGCEVSCFPAQRRKVMDRQTACNMIEFFWSEKRDIERWVDFDRDYLVREFPAVLKAWDDYKASRAAMDAAVREAIQTS